MENRTRVCPTLGRIALLTVTCLPLLDTSAPLFAVITGVLLVAGLPLYTYWDPQWPADVAHSIDEHGGDGSSTLVPGVLPAASVCREHFHSHPILATGAFFPKDPLLPLPFGPQAIYPFPEPLDHEW